MRAAVKSEHPFEPCSAFVEDRAFRPCYVSVATFYCDRPRSGAEQSSATKELYYGAFRLTGAATSGIKVVRQTLFNVFEARFRAFREWWWRVKARCHPGFDFAAEVRNVLLEQRDLLFGEVVDDPREPIVAPPQSQYRRGKPAYRGIVRLHDLRFDGAAACKPQDRLTAELESATTAALLT